MIPSSPLAAAVHWPLMDRSLLLTQNAVSTTCTTTEHISVTEERSTRSVAKLHTYQIPRSAAVEQLFCKREDSFLDAVGKRVIILIRISVWKGR